MTELIVIASVIYLLVAYMRRHCVGVVRYDATATYHWFADASVADEIRAREKKKANLAKMYIASGASAESAFTNAVAELEKEFAATQSVKP